MSSASGYKLTKRKKNYIGDMENSYGSSRKAKEDVSLQELRDRLAEFAEVRGWDQHHSPRNLLLALVSLYIYRNFSFLLSFVMTDE